MAIHMTLSWVLIAFAAVGRAAAADCACSGQSQADTERFGEGYGSRCAAWDERGAEDMWPSYGPYEGTADSGDGWACQSWCYVEDPDACPDAGQTWAEGVELYFSWEVCEDNAKLVDDCPWTGGDYDSCATCSGDAQVNTATYGEGYGSSCEAWDTETPDVVWPSYGPYEMTADSGDGWACDSWCYVDSSCRDASASWNEQVQLWFNYATCPDTVDDANCAWVGGDPNLSTGCVCSGQSQADTVRFGEGYGSRCAAWDQHTPDVMWPSYGPYEKTEDSGDAWTCASWCYVEDPDSCADAGATWAEGIELYFSWNACDDDASLTEDCPWTGGDHDSCTACANVAQSDTATYGDNYGAKCASHDQATCATMWPSYGPYEYTVDSGDGWCCDDWCYVHSSCPSALESWNEGSSLWYNYDACEDLVDDNDCEWVGGHGCVDSGDWHKKGAPWKDCDWVSRHSPTRCAVKGEDRTLAKYSCPAACRADAATCSDDPDWHKNGDETKHCAWVSRFPEKRCSVKGAAPEKTLANAACATACA